MSKPSVYYYYYCYFESNMLESKFLKAYLYALLASSISLLVITTLGFLS